MTITAELVAKLRERTGAGMMECKKALQAVAGDIEAAIEAMRKSGQAKADKKAGRVAAEGIVMIQISADAKSAIVLEINCETDFVARDDSFNKFANAIAAQALASKVNDVNALLALTLSNGQTVEQARQELIAKIGENIQVRRIAFVETDGRLSSYIHGGKIGVLVNAMGGDEQLGKDLAMHIAASNPLVVNRDQVPADVVAKEKEIFSAQAQTSGKPANVIEKMIEGRINKYLDEVSLLGQPFVKNPDMTIAQLLDKSQAKVIGFIRYGVGEGIEKQDENFVDAVMAQVRGS